MRPHPAAPLPLVALAAVLVGCTASTGSPSEDKVTGTAGTVTGTVAYLERIALPPDAVVQVQLSDLSRRDAPAAVIAESTVQPDGREVPLPFELRYDPEQIDPENAYAVRATIRSGSRLIYATTTATSVITGGNPDRVDLVLAQVSDGSTP